MDFQFVVCERIVCGGSAANRIISKQLFENLKTSHQHVMTNKRSHRRMIDASQH